MNDSYAQIPSRTAADSFKDCVRVMKSPQTELYFFFGDLYNGSGTNPHNFSDYVVKEVQLTGKTDGAAVVLDGGGVRKRGLRALRPAGPEGREERIQAKVRTIRATRRRKEAAKRKAMVELEE